MSALAPFGGGLREAEVGSHGKKAAEATKASVVAVEKLTDESSHARANAMGLDAEHERKILLVNREIKRIGYGRFQWALTFLCGTGWAVDNIIFTALSMSLPQINLEFNSSTPVQFMTFSLYVGLLVGATIWGIGSDIVGRRISWLSTLFIGSAFMTAVGAAPSFAATGVLLAFAGVGIGGSLPVDGALLCEFLPAAKQWVLTLLSLFWCLGQLFAALLGWAFIANYRCDELPCASKTNMGWRYLFFTTGGFSCFLWIARFFFFPVPESPKFLLSKGRDAEAIEVLDFIARQNRTINTLSLEDLRSASVGQEVSVLTDASDLEVESDLKDGTHSVKAKANAGRVKHREVDERVDNGDVSIPTRSKVGRQFLSMNDLAQIRQSLKQYDRHHMKLLFASRRMAVNTCLIMFCWACIGLAYPLYNAFIAIYIAQSGGDEGATTKSEQYRQLVIFAVLGIPGSLIATAAVELPRVGRRGAMAFFTCLTGCCLFGFTTARTPSQVLGWNCGVSLSQNAMYAILYAITYECFPTVCRGAGDGLAMSVQRVFGILPTFIAAYGATESSPQTPVFVSASLFLVASVAMLFLPFETRGLEAM